MTQKRKIIFIGDDVDYITEGQNYVAAMTSDSYGYEFLSIAPSASNETNLYDHLRDYDCLLVILDFTHQHLTPIALLSQIRQLKSHQFYRKVVFAGIFKNKLELEEAQTILQFGLNFLHVKGSDIPQFYNDCSYLAYESQLKVENYAIVKDLRLPYHLTMLNYISRITEEGFRINCDLENLPEPIKICHQFPENSIESTVSADNHFSAAEVAYALNSFDLRLHFSSPWEEDEENKLRKDEYLEWFDSDPGLYPARRNFLIWTQNEEIFEKLTFLKLPEGFNLHLTQLPLEDRIYSLEPEFLIIDLSPELTNRYPEFFWKILKPQSERSCEPFIIVFNCPISTNDFKVQFNYQKALCQPGDCSFSTLKSLVEVYAQKSKNLDPQGHKIFLDHDPRTFAEMKIPIVVTSLTEHEITFYHDTELALYSVFKLDVPVNCHVLIIPPYKELHKREDKFHHMGLIMGLDHDEAMEIRTFVNQAIFNPLKEFAIPKLKIQIPISAPVAEAAIEPSPLNSTNIGEKPVQSSFHRNPVTLKNESFRLRANFKRCKL